MKIEIELPKWTDGRTITILAGMEMVAIKPPDKPMLIVRKRCINCGKCCESRTNTAWKFEDKNGKCKYHAKDSTGLSQCMLGMYRPLACCLDQYSGGDEFCKIKLTEQK